jgi:hypothetical protein
MTLLAAGLLVSPFLLELPLVAGAVFLLTRGFFSIAIVVSPRLFSCLRNTVEQPDGQTWRG